jgi:lysozyme family protein
LFDRIKQEYQELTELIAKYVQIVETQFLGEPGAVKKERVISLVDEAIKLKPLWDDVLNLDGLVISIIVDKIVDMFNTMTGGRFDDVKPESIAKAIDMPLDAQVEVAASRRAGQSVDARLEELFAQYNIQKVTQAPAAIATTPAAIVPPISSLTQHKIDDAESWARCLTLVLGHEGALSNNANDRGGLTNLGITAGTLATAVANGVVTQTDVKKLTRDDAAKIYRVMYWDANGCQKIQWFANYLAFDACVNGGRGMWCRCAQESLNSVYSAGLVVDGKYGPKTSAAILKYFSYGKQIDVQQLNRWGTAYLLARKNYYDRIIARDASQKGFKNGWYNRLRNIAKQIGCNLPNGL